MKRYRTGLLAALCITILILDSQTALQGARDGVALCINTVIPSLFPFFIFSSIINTAIIGKTPRFLRPLGKLCGLPAGSESLLLLGLIGGYPVGAQAITDAYKQGAITKSTAKRILGFCNNAGPAFIFGMVSAFFDNPWVPWLLWLIQIISAILVGSLLPGRDVYDVNITNENTITLPKALQKSIHTMAAVSGWVVLFRVLLAFCDKWFLWLFSPLVRTVITGILELSNGCCTLSAITDRGIRFLIASGFLSFGGLCVCMQTASVCGELGLGSYLPGKLLQTSICLFLSTIFQPLLFPDTLSLYPVTLVFSIIAAIFNLLLRKNSSKTIAVGV